MGRLTVRPLGDEQRAIVNQRLRLPLADFVLRGAGQRDVDVSDVDPRPRALDVSECGLSAERRQGLAGELDSSDLLDVLRREARVALGHQAAPRVGQGHDDRAEFHALERGVLRDVARSRDRHALPSEGSPAGVLHHFFDVVDKPEARGLCFPTMSVSFCCSEAPFTL